MANSPYAGRREDEWLAITRRLISSHPLNTSLILDAALSAWDTLWRTTVGNGKTSVALDQLNVPATVIGYFFEVLLARELEVRCPRKWQRSQSKDQKDLVYVPDPALSVEVKTSGQAGYKIYGNRSYGQKSENATLVKKEKSGYYLTCNFWGQTITLLRFGWIDADDWKPQLAPTGQMAGLSDAVYRYKLIALPGAYRAKAPIQLLDGVGPATAEQFREHGIRTIQDLLEKRGGLPKKLATILARNEDYLRGCKGPS